MFDFPAFPPGGAPDHWELPWDPPIQTEPLAGHPRWGYQNYLWLHPQVLCNNLILFYLPAFPLGGARDDWELPCGCSIQTEPPAGHPRPGSQYCNLWVHSCELWNNLISFYFPAFSLGGAPGFWELPCDPPIQTEPPAGQPRSGSQYCNLWVHSCEMWNNLILFYFPVFSLGGAPGCWELPCDPSIQTEPPAGQPRPGSQYCKPHLWVPQCGLCDRCWRPPHTGLHQRLAGHCGPGYCGHGRGRSKDQVWWVYWGNRMYDQGLCVSTGQHNHQPTRNICCTYVTTLFLCYKRIPVLVKCSCKMYIYVCYRRNLRTIKNMFKNC